MKKSREWRAAQTELAADPSSKDEDIRDLAPLVEAERDFKRVLRAEQIGARMERESTNLEISVLYMPHRGGHSTTMIEGKDYVLSDNEIHFRDAPKKGSWIGIVRRGGGAEGRPFDFEHITWIPSAKTFQKEPKP